MEDKKPLLHDVEDASLFEEPLKPKKAWYKRWWLISYAVIFVVSLGVLIIFSQITNQVLDSIDVDDGVGEEFLGIQTGFSPLPENKMGDVGGASSLETSLIGSEDDPSIGNPNAPVVIVEFSDFQCPFCKESAVILKELVAKYPNDVYLVYRDFPITDIHPESLTAAEAGQCAHEQNLFWPYHDLLFASQDNLDQATIIRLAAVAGLDVEKFSNCLDNDKYLEEVLTDFEIGVNLGVAGTPSFFVNGFIVSGVVPLDSWSQMVELVRFSE